MTDRTPSNRRDWLKSTLAVGAGIALSRNGLAAPSAVTEDVRVISQQPEMYHGWPTLARRKNGELLLVCSGGREQHVCPFGRVELMRSHDGGATWSFPRVVMDGPIDDRDAGVLETARGTILVTTFTSLAYEPILMRARTSSEANNERWQRWEQAHNRVSAEQRQATLDVCMKRSTDGGVSFSGRYSPLVNSPHGPIQLADGRLLYAGKELWKGTHRVGVSESQDDGVSWQWLAVIPTREGDTTADYHELHAVETTDGRLIAHIRNHSRQNSRETLQSQSDDGGRTWTTPHPIGVWGLPSHLLRLRDGRLLMSYGYRRPPFGNQARLSEDGGKSWSEPITISGDGIGGDLGYPSTVELDDGSLVTVWYEVMKGSSKAVLRQSKWALK
jgi:sialidase-1